MDEQTRYCPKCEEVGEIGRISDNMLTIRCPTCKLKWQVESGTCPTCGSPNHFFDDGLCLACYKEKYYSTHKKTGPRIG